MNYRSDIDGLRALAVLSVVFFHGGFTAVGGGFVGVDVFFVISGFLITSIVLNDLEEGRFSVRDFYERRIRRIIPALYVVCAVSLVVSFFLFLPGEFKYFGKSLAATIGFVSNILFWSETGYFDASSELKPLLHTWSLAVEEQFYVVFPLCLLFVHRFFGKKYFVFIFVAMAASLALSVWGVHHKPSATFYWAPTRAWELLVGSLLALGVLPKPQNKILANLGGLLGLGLIVYAALFFDYKTVFPGANALFPCIGAALLLHFHRNTETFTCKLLSSKPLVFVGLCSYSFYLWHWPVFVFANYMSMEPLPHFASAMLIALSFALAVLTWKYVEAPFRDRRFLAGRWRIFIIVGLLSIPLLAASAAIVYTNGLPSRFSDIQKLEDYRGSILDKACMDISIDAFEEKKCLFGDVTNPETSFVVWGDSHAGAMVRGIGHAASAKGKSGYLAGYSGCIPLIGVTGARAREPDKCNEAAQKVLEGIKSGDVVFLVGRWGYYTHKSIVNKEGPTWINDSQSREISEDENYAVFTRSLKRTIAALLEKGARPVLVDTVPEFSKSVPEAYYRFKRDIVVPEETVKKNRHETSAVIESMREEGTVSYIDPLPVFCEEGLCYGTKEGRIYFSDDDHVNLDGALKASVLFEGHF